MKRALFAAIALLLLPFAVPSADAQIVYGISAIDYNPETTIVDGYSITQLDYYACYYYDSYVEGFLFQNFGQVDFDYDGGGCQSVAFTDTFANTGNTYTVLSDHYIVAYYYYPGLGYYDPYGFSGFGGEYGGSYNFNGCFGCGGYYFAQYIYLGSTAVSIAPEPPCTKEPTLNPRRGSVTRGGTMTFTIENLCDQRTIENWKFIEAGTVTVNRSVSKSSKTWSGVMVQEGIVAVTVTQGGTTFTPIAEVTIDPRASTFKFPAVGATRADPGVNVDGDVLTIARPPSDGSLLGSFSIRRQRATWTPAPQINDNGPNHGYKFLQSAVNRDTTKTPAETQFVYVISKDLDPAEDFYKAQCGDYHPFLDRGFISGAKLLENTINHEAGTINSHHQKYVAAQNDPANNIGLGLDSVTARPTETFANLQTKANQRYLDRGTAIINATRVEPCGASNTGKDQACVFWGYGNYQPYVPCPPAGLTGVVQSSTKVNLSWQDKSFNEDGFAINRRVGSGDSFQIDRVPANQLTYSDTGATASTDYTYTVQAFTGTVFSSKSNEAMVRTPSSGGGGGGSAPAAPAGATAASASSSQIIVSWTDASSNEDGFKIERRTGSGTFSQIATAGANATSYADSSVTAATAYTYRVRAFNSIGDSPYSNEISATIPGSGGGPSPLGAPSNLATTAFDSQVVLLWTDNSTDETGFKIERANAGGSFAQIATVGANVTNHADTTISINVSYVYRVRAYNAAGDSAYSNEAGATPAIPIPNPPSNLTATVISTSRVDLTWVDQSYNEDGFRLERKIGSGAFSLLATLSPYSTSYSDTTVVASTTYSYRVKAFNAGGESPSASLATVTTPANNNPPPPAAPSNLAGATSQSAFGIEVWWTDNSANETSVRLEKRGSNSFPFVEVAWLDPDTMSYFDPDASPGMTYVYRVRACNDWGCSAYSSEAWVTYQP